MATALWKCATPGCVELVEDRGLRCDRCARLRARRAVIDGGTRSGERTDLVLPERLYGSALAGWDRAA
jgi:hypothetical protein